MPLIIPLRARNVFDRPPGARPEPKKAAEKGSEAASSRALGLSPSGLSSGSAGGGGVVFSVCFLAFESASSSDLRVNSASFFDGRFFWRRLGADCEVGEVSAAGFLLLRLEGRLEVDFDLEGSSVYLDEDLAEVNSG
jgi:hypothetical protein